MPSLTLCHCGFMNYASGHAAVLVTCGNHEQTTSHLAVEETFKLGC